MVAPRSRVTVVTVTLGRDSLARACASVDAQTHGDWHHVVLGDGVRPPDVRHPRRSTLGFSRALGAEEPGANMPDGTPNPLQRWALRHLDLGDFVCFLDDDNEYEPRFLERMTAALDARPDVGLALCEVDDRRYGRRLGGRPRYGECDNSGFMLRAPLARQVDFPPASPDREVCQDCEYIAACAARFGWVRVPEVLVVFGAGPDTPAARGGLKLLQSWEMPLRAAGLARAGDHEAAAAMLERAIEIDPADAWSVWTLAEVELVRGRRDRAVDAFGRWRDMVSGDPRMAHAWLRYCWALASHVLGDTEGRDAALEQAWQALRPREESGDPVAEQLFHAGLLHLLAGRAARGRADIEAAIERRPGPRLVERATWRLRVLHAAGVEGAADLAAAAAG
jgi:tetratricopeptide (TPR) repeat protein